MKRMLGFLCVAVAAAPLSVLAQGDLLPAGAPGPTMKTLTQVEPRTPIESLPYTINTAGSYYLAGNLTSAGHGVIVNADNVTVDLMGFTIRGSRTGSSAGLLIQPGAGERHYVTVRNGIIRDFHYGVFAENLGQSVFQDLVVASNVNIGIYVRAYSMPCRGNRIERCTLSQNGDSGILASSYSSHPCNDNVIRDCVVSENGNEGIELDGGGGGICNGNRIEGCVASGNAQSGVLLAGGSGECEGNLVAGCTLDGNVNQGIHVSADCRANRLERNVVRGNSVGMKVYGAANYVADNTVLGNTLNYDFTAGNQLNLLLCEVPETLAWPCSVKFAGTLELAIGGVNGINVDANDVTIDMNGHALVGPGTDSGEGIYQDAGYKNLRVFNGKLSNWAKDFYDGIYACGENNRFEHLQVVSNYYGIYCTKSSVISDCSALGNLRTGFYGQDSVTLTGNSAVGNRLDGIHVVSNCTVIGNSLSHNGTGEYGAGIRGYCRNRIERNHVTHCDVGLLMEAGQNYVADNIVIGGAMNYSFTSENHLNLLISEIPETLRWPCVAKLAGSLWTASTTSNGISVLADDVTIDLAGFSLTGPGHQGDVGTCSGIYQAPNRQRLTVINGILNDWYEGIHALGTWNRIERVRLHDNVMALIAAGTNTSVSECSAEGLWGGELSGAIICGAGSVITRCRVDGGGSAGISVSSKCLVTENVCSRAASAQTAGGIAAAGVYNRIDGNHVFDNDIGIWCTGTSNLVVRNSAYNNHDDDYNIAADNDVGDFLVAPGFEFSSDQPWANFER